MQNPGTPRNQPRAPSFCCDRLEPRVLLAATLVKDVNLVTPPSYPGWFTDLNGTLLFMADDGAHGPDWWRSDGTAAGTRLVKDLDLVNPFGRTPPPMRRLTAVVGGAMLFAGPRTDTAFSLYKTDGTEAGTVPVTAALPGGPSFFVTRGNEAFFASSGQVWKSDGTAAGTARVTSFAGSPSARPLAALGDKVLFQAVGPGGAGMELWVTDGSETGTVLLKDINPGAAGSDPGFSFTDPLLETESLDRFVVAGGKMYFSATTAANGRELWVTDGTPDGTHLVADIVPGPGNASPWKIAGHDGAVYFTASITSGATSNLNLYRVAPDNSGAAVVGTLPEVRPLALASGGQRLLLLAMGPAYPAPTLYTLDDAGTALVTVRSFQSAPPRVLSSQTFARLGEFSYFYLNGGASFGGPPSASELWRTDGTPAGTTRVATSAPLFQSLDPISVFSAGGVVYFPSGTVLTQTELWRTDGTPQGTFGLGDINAATTHSSSPTAPVQVTDGRWLFAANDGVNGDGFPQLWVTDGTGAGTRRLAHPSTGAGITVVPQMERLVANVTRQALGVSWKGRVYFGARVGTGNSLYSSDGTFGGTRELRSFFGMSGPTDLFPFGDRLLFWTHESAANRRVLWTTDGTPGGTYEVTRFNAPNSSPLPFAVLGNDAYFNAPGASGGDELWKTDGTPAGTVRVKDIYPGDAGSGPAGMTRLGDHLYFSAHHPTSGRELWRTDGTEAGTVLVKDVYPGFQVSFGTPSASTPTNLRSVNGWLLFEARDAESPAVNRLYRSDGTAAGTVPLTPANFSPKQIGALNLIGGGLVAYFFRQPSDGKPELWRTDGQPETTQLVKVFDAAGLPPTAVPVGIDGAIVYVRITESTLNFPTTAGPSELWQSDGTLGGTRRVFSGAFQAKPDNAVVFGDRLFFTADDGVVGNELRTELLGAHVVGRHLFYNGSVFDGNDREPDAADDAAIAPDKTALLPGQVASFGNLSSYSRGINGIMIDVSGNLPMTALAGIGGSVGLKVGAGGDPDTWADAPPHVRLAIRPGAGVGGSDRITLLWPDGAIRNTWLRVTVKALPMSGLARPDVFFFGNLVGETGDAGGPLAVGGTDLLATRRALARATAAAVDSRHDFNRDGRVTAFDLALARASQGRALTPVANSGVAVAPAAADARRRAAASRSQYAPPTDAVRQAAGDLF